MSRRYVSHARYRGGVPAMEIFDKVGVDARVHAVDIDNGREVGMRADEQVPASLRTRAHHLQYRAGDHPAADPIADHPGTPQTILVTHTHWDHYNDVPHIAQQSGARIFGTLTAYHLGLAFGLPSSQLSPVKGGEVLDFGDYTVEVVASLHSRNAAYSVGLPGVRVTVPAKPETIADLPEGDTLACQVTPRGGPSVFFMGASDFVERNLAGLAPDVGRRAPGSCCRST